MANTSYTKVVAVVKTGGRLDPCPYSRLTCLECSQFSQALLPLKESGRDTWDYGTEHCQVNYIL